MFEWKLREKGNFILFSYASFFTGIFFNLRAVSSISVGLLLLLSLLDFTALRKRVSYRPASFFVVSCFLYVTLVFVAFLTFSYTASDLQLKSGLLFVPVAVAASFPTSKKLIRRVLMMYCIILLFACLYCLVLDLIHFFETNESATFFYYSLVLPLKQHAVYFSIYILGAIIFLNFFTSGDGKQKRIIAAGSLFFSIFLVLLSSRLVILFFIVLLFGTIYLRLRKEKKRVLLISIVILVASCTAITSTNNPVGRRFSEIFSGDPYLAERDHYNHDVYFNGAQFRLLQWRVVPQILRNNGDWLKGVGPDSSQAFLNEAYTQKGMYMGNSENNDPGYGAYNAHNQFLESLLRYGMPGLICFVLICLSIVLMMWPLPFQSKLFMLLLLGYCFVESVIETQYGIIIFTMYPVFFSCLSSANQNDS
jgi:O-antigen ligase